jgi:hypothetical protein
VTYTTSINPFDEFELLRMLEPPEPPGVPRATASRFIVPPTDTTRSA